MTRSAIGRWALVLLIVSVVIRYWELLPMVVRQPLSVLGAVILVYLALAATSIAGLLRGRRWGVYACAALVVYGTVMLSLSFFPVPFQVFPAWVHLTVVNAAVLTLAGLTGWWMRSEVAPA